MWYGGEDGWFIVVTFRSCESQLGWEGKIMRFERYEHALAEFERVAVIEVGSLGHQDGVYLFVQHDLRRHSGAKFGEYTGERELPDDRW
jgi:hypothetical protein